MNQPGHWTNDELLASLYGIGPDGNHLQSCADCQARLAAMQSHRERIEQAELPVDSDFLAAQRRTIYKRLDQPIRWWNSLSVRRWAAGLTTACVLAASLAVYERHEEVQLAQERAADAKLIQQVTEMASDSTASSMAPLEGLFE